MAYVRTTWENGITPINAANLNNIEEGINEAKTEVRSIEAGGTGANNATAAVNNLGIKDYIVEQGTKGSWEYRKWNSGKAEAWGRNSATWAVTTALGNIYRSDSLTITVPTGIFNGTPKVFASIPVGGGNWIGKAWGNSATSIGFYILGGTSYTSTQTVDFYLVGKWK